MKVDAYRPIVGRCNMLLPNRAEIDPYLIPDHWTIAIDYWYDQLPDRAQAYVIDRRIMDLLHFAVPEKVAGICGKHAGAIRITDVALCRQRVFQQIDGFEEAISWLADFLRFTDRRTRKNWARKVNAPRLLERVA